MKILHTVEHYFPSPGGMQEVVRQLSERMVKLGHEVTVATSAHPQRTLKIMNGVQIKEFAIEGNAVRGMKGAIDSYEKFLLTSEFDIVTNFAAQQWATDIALPVLSQIHSKKVFVPTGFSGLHLPEYQNYFGQMKTWMQQYDMNIFLSANYRDINFAKEHGINKRIIIPNGAAEDEFFITPNKAFRNKYGIAENALLILHVGSFTGLKGHREAVEIFLKSKLRDAFLLMIGNGNENVWKSLPLSMRLSFRIKNLLNNKKILLTSLNRDEIIQAYHAADLFLFPSNIECSPLVLFESMASGTPFLTSAAGNAAEIIEWTHGGILVKTDVDRNGYSHVDIKEAAKKLSELARNKNERDDLAKNGFNAWKKKFTWEKITEQYLELYKSLLHHIPPIDNMKNHPVNG